jgi:hypothetical protein
VQFIWLNRIKDGLKSFAQLAIFTKNENVHLSSLVAVRLAVG